MIGVYRIDLPNGVYYYGQTSDFERRQREHINELCGGYHSNSNLQQAFNLTPHISWTFESTCDTLEAIALEDYYITLNRGDPNMANFVGNNYTTAGMRALTGKSQSIETISKRISKTTGLKRTTQFKAARSEQYKINPRIQENMAALHERAKRAVVVDGKKYLSVKEAALVHNVSPSTVIQRIRSPYFEGWSY